MKICLFTINAKNFTLPPYGIWVLKAYIEKYAPVLGIDVEVHIQVFDSETSIDEIANTISILNPTVVGGSHYIWNDNKMLAVLPKLREKLSNTHILLGGPHTEIKDERLIRLMKEKVVDGFIIGEGEIPLLNVINDIYKHGEIFPTQGLYCMKEEEFIRFSPLILPSGKHINFLPNPYEVLDDLTEVSLLNGSIQYETSRGCPFSCTFCDQGHKRYRSLTMDRIKKDLKLFSTWNVGHIDFLDGTFNLNPKRTIEILEYLIELNQDWTFHAEIKPELLTEKEIELMKQANFKTVELGLQSIHSDTLKVVKRRNNWNKLEQTVEILLRHDVEVVINTIIGLPNETLNNWYESLNYCFNLGNVIILSNILKILPNTEMSEQTDLYGFKYDINNFNAITETNTFSQEDIKMAVLVNRLVNIYWNNAGRPKSIRQIVSEYYRNNFHEFLEELALFILNLNQVNFKDIYFKKNILKSFSEEKQFNQRILDQIVNDFSYDEMNAVVK